jgi:16S rRNA processing protein RimM
VSEAGHEEYVTIARVLRVRGNRGEVAAEDLSDGQERFAEGASFVLSEPSGKRKQAVLEEAWNHQGRLILKFAGVDSISDAELLRGCEVQIPRSELGPAPEGEFYFEDLIGAKIVEADTGREIGEVEQVLEGAGGPVLLQVRSQGREILIPFAEHICVEIKPQDGVIRVRMPDGLEDLNS